MATTVAMRWSILNSIWNNRSDSSSYKIVFPVYKFRKKPEDDTCNPGQKIVRYTNTKQGYYTDIIGFK